MERGVGLPVLPKLLPQLPFYVAYVSEALVALIEQTFCHIATSSTPAFIFRECSGKVTVLESFNVRKSFIVVRYVY